MPAEVQEAVGPRRRPVPIRRAWAALALAAGIAVAAPLAASAPASAADPNLPVRLAIAVPLTVPPSSNGLLDADALEAYTRPLGILTRQLDAVIDRPVAIGVDPMIIASIRVLGPNAPETALDWLERLDGATNQVFPLAYADADLSLAAQAGAAAPPAPTTFPLVPGEVPDEEPDEPTATPTPDPTGDPVEPELPEVDDLLEWRYTFADVAWPRDDTVVAADLGVFAMGGYTRTILASTNVAREASSSVVSEIDGHGVLVHDAAVSAALRSAAGTTDVAAWDTSMIALMDALAAAARTQPGETATVFASLGREVPFAEGRLAETLDALAADPRITSISLSAAMAGEPNAASVVDLPQPAERIVQASLLLDSDERAQRFATVAEDPGALSGPERLGLLALLSNSWESNQAGWPAAVDEHLTAAAALSQRVQVGETSRLNLLADRQTLPIPIVNGLDQRITVVVTVDPSRPILAIEDRSVEVTIEPDSQANALVPVQAVTNGTVDIEVTLTSPEGVPVGDPKSVEVVVNAGWETPIFVVLASAVVLLFVGGIVRNIVRRRREAAAEAA